jgi:hypothetical protein
MSEIPNLHNLGSEWRRPGVTNEVRLTNYRPAPAPRPLRVPAPVWQRIVRIAESRHVDPCKIVSALMGDFANTHSAGFEEDEGSDWTVTEIRMHKSTATQFEQFAFRLNKTPGDCIAHLLATANRLPSRKSHEV